MLPSAFRFVEDLARFPGHIVCHPGATRTHGLSSAFSHHSIIKTMLRASSAPSASSLPVSGGLRLLSLLLEDFSSVVFDNTQLHACFAGVHKFSGVEIVYLLWKVRTGSIDRPMARLKKMKIANIEWVAKVLLLSKLACWRQVKRGTNALLGVSRPPIDGCPVLRVLCEGWDRQISPFSLPRKADLFIGRPGYSGQDPLAKRNPGLKSETWATHSKSDPPLTWPSISITM
jgi:hypothetical protein